MRKLSVVVLVAVAVTFNPFSVYKVQGDSMSPTVEDGEFVVTVGRGASVKTGSIVVVKRKGKFVLKRILGTEGDEIEFRHGMLFRNGERVEETYCSGENKDYLCKVPEGKVFVVGDNREHSFDSRDFGCVKVEAVKRVVVGKPFNGFGAE